MRCRRRTRTNRGTEVHRPPPWPCNHDAGTATAIATTTRGSLVLGSMLCPFLGVAGPGRVIVPARASAVHVTGVTANPIYFLAPATMSPAFVPAC